MKMTNKYMILPAVAIAIASAVSSCTMESPFDTGKEASLTLITDIRGDIKQTRAIEADEMTNLRDNCVVYIENNKGVIRKYKGLDNIPPSIPLRTGSYVVEAWSGDSVTASFDKKFYRGWQEIEVLEDNNMVNLKCNIANVVVSVDPASLNVDLEELKVTFANSRGSLEFNEENIASAKGYFMMPKASEGSGSIFESSLSYKIEGKKKGDGSAYLKEGTINNVERAHEYSLKISQDQAEITEGAGLIRITIKDIPIIEEEVEIFSAPSVRGVGYELEKQVVSTNNSFADTKVFVHAYFALSSLSMTFSDNFTGLSSYSNILEGTAISDLNAKGISVERVQGTESSSTLEGGSVAVDQVYVTFSKAFLDALPASDTEYTVTFNATDGHHKEGSGVLRIATSENAIERLAPVGTADAPDPETAPMAVLATSATLTGYVYDDTAASGYGIAYREQGTEAWTSVAASSAAYAPTRASVKSFSVKLTGLKMGTTYEYKTYCNEYDECEIKTFTTESKFVIPNASFEEWGTYAKGTKSIIIPGTTGDKTTSYWGTGNEGASTASLTLTDKSTEMVHSGTYCAKLESKSAFSVLAAGNIFTGTYLKTEGTDGRIGFGREYNGTHPTKVKAYINYRPGSVDVYKDGIPDASFVKGGSDHGQIYIALTDAVIEVFTGDKSTLFSASNEHVLAYGQVTFKENYGADGVLEMIEIPFEYNERAKNKKPTHLVIVACASKFGDYFSGSYSSVMYLDDFELVYE